MAHTQDVILLGNQWFWADLEITYLLTNGIHSTQSYGYSGQITMLRTRAKYISLRLMDRKLASCKRIFQSLCSLTSSLLGSLFAPYFCFRSCKPPWPSDSPLPSETSRLSARACTDGASLSPSISLSAALLKSSSDRLRRDLESVFCPSALSGTFRASFCLVPASHLIGLCMQFLLQFCIFHCILPIKRLAEHVIGKLTKPRQVSMDQTVFAELAVFKSWASVHCRLPLKRWTRESRTS